MAIIDEIKEQSDSVRQGGRKAWLKWFWSYYKIHVFAGIAILIFAGSMIHDIVTQKDTVFGITLLNIETTEGAAIQAPLEDELGALLEINPKKEEARLDISEFISPGVIASEQEMIAQQKLMALFAAGEVDLFSADPWNFTSYALSNSFLDLRGCLSEETLKELEPYLFYIDNARVVMKENDDGIYTDDSAIAWQEGTILEYTDTAEIRKMCLRDAYTLPDPAAMEDPVPVGFLITEAPYFSGLGFYDYSASVMGIAGSSKRVELADKVVRYLWDRTGMPENAETQLCLRNSFSPLSERKFPTFGLGIPHFRKETRERCFWAPPRPAPRRGGRESSTGCFHIPRVFGGLVSRAARTLRVQRTVP